MIINLHNQSDTDLLHRYADSMSDFYGDLGQTFTVGLTSGVFDLFHKLHLQYLRRCRGMCDVLIVGVDSDDLVRARKGQERPIVPEKERLDLVASLDCVTIAFILRKVEEYSKAIQDLRVDVIFKNQNYRDKAFPGSDMANVVIVQDLPVEGNTTSLIKRIRDTSITMNRTGDNV